MLSGSRKKELTDSTKSGIRIILSVISVILFASCATKAIPIVHLTGPEAGMAMEFNKPAYGLTAIAVSKDGSYVLTADNDNRSGIAEGFAKSTVRLWNISSGKLVRAYKTDRWIYNLEFSPDGKYAVGSGSPSLFGEIHALKLWEMPSGELVWEFTPGYKTKSDFLWKKPVTSSYSPERVSFSPDGKFILVPGDPVSMVEVSNGEIVSTFIFNKGEKDPFDLQHIAGPGYSSRAVYSPDGKLILAGNERFEEFKLLDARTLQEIRRFRGHEPPFHISGPGALSRSLSFSPDGKYAMSSIASDDTVIIWDIRTGGEVRTLTGFEDAGFGFHVLSSSFSPDGTSAFILGLPLKIWDIASGEGRAVQKRIDIQINSNPANGGTFNPNGRNVVFSFGDSGVSVIDADTGKETALLVGFEDGEWIVITPEGYYNSSEKGAQYLSVKVGGKKYDTNLFFDVFYRPDIVMAKLHGEDIKDLV